MSLELAWTLLSTLGAALATWGFFDAWRDVAAIGNRTNGRRIIAFGYMRSEAIAGTVHGLLLLIGIGPLLDPQPVSFSAFVLALMGVNILLVAKSLLDARDRIRVRRALTRG